MELKLYDTLSREKRTFAPIDRARVRMYVCGPTVYDFAHIGNARPVIVFDVLFRLLRHLYGETHVTYVRNITDVDDKINARAAESGVSIRDLTEGTYKNFKEDVAALGCLPPTVEPRATEHIEEMKTLIERLVASGHAYVAEEHVLFSVPAMPDYGKLSKRPLDEMIAGARVDVAPYKRSPMDFVLWKPSKESEPSWPSPSGIASPGRPGWHIECSAMAWKHLGQSFDIHGGGIDLVFPHHENEIAQTRCAFHSDVMANVWMHNGFLQVEGEKMSKSLGNFITIRELLGGGGKRAWPGEVIKLTMLATHYRLPIDFSDAKLRFWWTKLCHWVSRFSTYGSQKFDEDLWFGEAEMFPSKEIETALSDDLNFAEGISYLDRLVQRANKQDSDAADEIGRNLIWLGLMRRTHLRAYDDRIFGGARPDLLRKYSEQLQTARALVLNQYVFSRDAVQRDKSLSEIRNALTNIDPSMSLDGVHIVVSENLDVSLEPTTSTASIDTTLVQQLIDARTAARKAKDFAASDRIRDELARMGVVLKDSKDGTTWEIAR